MGKWSLTGCVGKVPHVSYVAAEASISHVRASRRDSGGKIEIYRCPECGFYHVGHATGRLAKHRRQQPYKRDRRPIEFEREEM